MSKEVKFSENKVLEDSAQCSQACVPVRPPPDNDYDGEHDEEPVGEQSESYDSEDNAAVVARALGKTKHQFEGLVYEKDLADITCACGHGYFKPDKTWIAGSEVRGGNAPPKPQNWE
ncbi:unnamed protein product [Alternaria alternata]